MPAYKHPCPHCGQFIQRDVAACPFCGRRDPFAPARCEQCRTVLEDPRWIACPRCGAPTGARAAAAVPEPGQAGGDRTGLEPASPSARDAGSPRATVCSGCGAPLPAGARFCRECGTLADSPA